MRKVEALISGVKMGSCSPKYRIPRLLVKNGKRAFLGNNGRRARTQPRDLTKLGS